MCPYCGIEIDEYDVQIYDNGMTIYLKYHKCPECNAIVNPSIKFIEEGVH